MILILGLFFIIISIIFAVITFFRSNKPLRTIIDEAKYEIHYNILGFNGLVEDFFGKEQNITGKKTFFTTILLLITYFHHCRIP